MLFAITCIDGPRGLEIRKQIRADHLAHIDAHAENQVLVGPLLHEDGETPAGSLLVMDFPSLTEARAFAESDPYKKAGVFESVSVHPFRKVRPN